MECQNLLCGGKNSICPAENYTLMQSLKKADVVLMGLLHIGV